MTDCGPLLALLVVAGHADPSTPAADLRCMLVGQRSPTRGSRRQVTNQGAEQRAVNRVFRCEFAQAGVDRGNERVASLGRDALAQDARAAEVFSGNVHLN